MLAILATVLEGRSSGIVSINARRNVRREVSEATRDAVGLTCVCVLTAVSEVLAIIVVVGLKEKGRSTLDTKTVIDAAARVVSKGVVRYIVKKTGDSKDNVTSSIKSGGIFI